MCFCAVCCGLQGSLESRALATPGVSCRTFATAVHAAADRIGLLAQACAGASKWSYFIEVQLGVRSSGTSCRVFRGGGAGQANKSNWVDNK